MTYAISEPLQTAIFSRLSSDPVIQSHVGTAVYDALPAGSLPPLYISLGPERVLDASDKTGFGAWHRFSVSVVSSAAGFATAKQVAGVVTDLLKDADLDLSRGRLVALNFERATAKRIGAGNIRQIDLSFRARVEDA
jgi:hypothetical protein